MTARVTPHEELFWLKRRGPSAILAFAQLQLLYTAVCVLRIAPPCFVYVAGAVVAYTTTTKRDQFVVCLVCGRGWMGV